MSQLSSLVESQLQYHRQAVQVLEELSDKLKDRCSDDKHQHTVEGIWERSAFCLKLLVVWIKK